MSAPALATSRLGPYRRAEGGAPRAAARRAAQRAMRALFRRRLREEGQQGLGECRKAKVCGECDVVRFYII